MDHTPPDRPIAGESSHTAAVLPAAVPRATRGAQRDALRAELPRVPLTTAELISDGVRPELLASLALRRACGGGVAKSGGHYFEWGRLLPSYLAGAFDELADTGLLAMAQEAPGGLRRVRLTQAGHARCAQLRVPDPGFSTPAGCRWSERLSPRRQAGHQLPPEVR